MKRALTAVVLVLFLVAACGPRPDREATPTPIPTSVVPDKPTYVVARGTVENLEEFTARVSPIEEESLYFKKSGYVKLVHVDKGDWVEEGTVLAELELEDLMNQLALVQVDLESVQNQYAEAEAAHERQLFGAQMSLEVIKLRLERAKVQAPIADFTSYRLSIERAEEVLAEAKNAYKEALDRPWDPQRIRDALLKNITNAERNLTEVQARYQTAVRQQEQARKAHEVDLQLLELEVKKAEQELEWLQRGLDPTVIQRVQSARLKVERLEDQIATGQLVAPFEGEITSLNVIPGRAVEAHKPVAVIANPDLVDIAADLTSNQMGLMEEGQAAEITITREPGRIYEAIITRLPYPYGTGGGQTKAEDEDERVHVELLDPAALDLEAGDLVKVTVLIERSEDALYLPPAAVRTFEGREFVMVKVDGRLQKVDIKLGIEGKDRVEVLTGLEEGQVIEGL